MPDIKSLFKFKSSTPINTLESHFDTENEENIDQQQLEAEFEKEGELDQEETTNGASETFLDVETTRPLRITPERPKLGVVIPKFQLQDTKMSSLIASSVDLPKENLWNRFMTWLQPRLPKDLFHLPPPSIEPVNIPTKLPSLNQVKKVVIVGTHGWFPRQMVLALVGQPTGTSSKFAEMTVETVNHMFESQNNPLSEDDIAMFALHHQGRVEERVQVLFQHLAQHRQTFEQAQVVLMSAHSQGVVVTTHLLHLMIQNGILDPNRQRIGLLAMAGICHGPFPALSGNPVIKYLEKDAARELFEFCWEPLPDNASYKFESSLKSILDAGVRVACVASWKDQVVPIYSALVARYTHPNLYRTVFIPTEDYLPNDFLVKLVEWCVKRRNRGLYDHGLLIHVSEVVAGDLVGGKGHSTLYEEPQTYQMAMDWLFAPSNESQVKWQIHHLHNFSNGKATTPNPYFLPWIMAQLLNEGDEELEKIVSEFGKWQPRGKRAKELRFRLEPLLNLSKL